MILGQFMLRGIPPAGTLQLLDPWRNASMFWPQHQHTVAIAVIEFLIGA